MKTKIFQIYKQLIKSSIYPMQSSHMASMNIEIKKGQKEGQVVIPCSIYALSHETDLNPSLIRIKDNKVVKKYPVNKKISYNSNKYKLVLTDDEKKKGYELREIDRCKHCGQKIVIAEMAETQYKSCPKIKVTLADKAKQDIIVPIKFGFRKSNVFAFLALSSFIFGWGVWYLYQILFDNALIGFNWLFYIIWVPVLFFLYIYWIPANSYRGYKLFRWYLEVRPTLKKVKQNVWWKRRF